MPSGHEEIEETPSDIGGTHGQEYSYPLSAIRYPLSAIRYPLVPPPLESPRDVTSPDAASG